MLLDREHLAGHRRWLAGTILLTAAAVGWTSAYALRWDDRRWPGGGSLPGLTFGVVGGLIIVFEMLLWPRKYLWRGRRRWPLLPIPLGSTRGWMKVHIWLGLLCLPLLLLHGGFRLDPRGGSSLAVGLTWLLVGVIGSGVWGLAQQNQLPRRLYEEIPGETIHAQMGHVLEQYRREARQVVEAACGPPERSGESASFLESVLSARVAMRPGRVDARGEAVAGAEPLRGVYEDSVRLFLNAEIGRGGRHALGSAPAAAALFVAARAELPPAAHPALERLADLCDRRRQLDRQDRLFRRLHAWLAVHFALSLSLLLMMGVHIALALRYL